MNLYEAKVTDVLRLNQRDEAFLNGIEDQLHSFLKLMGARNYYKINRSIPVLANVWYYFMTTLGNLQTLGEEYTGTIRINSNKKIPSATLHVLWLILHVGGEPLLERLLNYSKTKITRSSNLTAEAKNVLLKCINLLKEEKPTLKRIHNSLFYMDGRFYNISNRLTGVRYVLLRQWLQDDSFTGSFYLLGHISLFYTLFSSILKLFSPEIKKENADTIINVTESIKGCLLCGENLKAASSTPCGHIFCWKCIYDCLSYQKSCPICRETVNPSRIIYLQNFI